MIDFASSDLRVVDPRKPANYPQIAGFGVICARSSCLGHLPQLAARPVVGRIAQASHAGQLPAGPPESLFDAALTAGVIQKEEADKVREAMSAREDAIQVDSFPLEEYLRLEQPDSPLPAAVSV